MNQYLRQTHGSPLRAIAQGQLQKQQWTLCSEVHSIPHYNYISAKT